MGPRKKVASKPQKENPNQPYAVFTTRIAKILKMFKHGRKKAQNPKELGCIQGLVFFTKNSNDDDLRKCLSYIASKVMSIEGEHFIPLSWAYSKIVRYRKPNYACLNFDVVNFFRFCVERRASTLHHLHKLTVIIRHSRAISNLSEVNILGNSATMEQLIVKTAQKFSPTILTLDDIEKAVFGSSRVESYFSIRKAADSSPSLIVFSRRIQKSRVKIRRGMSVRNVIQLIKNRLVLIGYKTVLSNDMLTPILREINRGYKSRSVVESLVLLWVYVGILSKGMTPGVSVKTKVVEKVIKHLFQSAVQVDTEKNYEHIINLWTAIGSLHKESPIGRDISLKKAENVLREAYPNKKLHLKMASYIPDKFFEDMSNIVENKVDEPPPCQELNLSSMAEEDKLKMKKRSHGVLSPSALERRRRRRKEKRAAKRRAAAKERAGWIKEKLVAISQNQGLAGSVGEEDNETPTDAVVPKKHTKEEVPEEPIDANASKKKKRKSDAITQPVPMKEETPQNEETVPPTPSIPPIPSNRKRKIDNQPPELFHPPIKEEPQEEQYFLPPSPEDYNDPTTTSQTPDQTLFVTDPNLTIKLNPVLFPSRDTLSWTAGSLLPSKRRRSSTKVNNDAINSAPLTIPSDCRETILDLNSTDDEYLDLTMASNYYAQGVKVVDGLHRIVFYHRVMM